MWENDGVWRPWRHALRRHALRRHALNRLVLVMIGDAVLVGGSPARLRWCHWLASDRKSVLEGLEPELRQILYKIIRETKWWATSTAHEYSWMVFCCTSIWITHDRIHRWSLGFHCGCCKLLVQFYTEGQDGWQTRGAYWSYQMISTMLISKQDIRGWQWVCSSWQVRGGWLGTMRHSIFWWIYGNDGLIDGYKWSWVDGFIDGWWLEEGTNGYKISKQSATPLLMMVNTGC